MSFTSFDFVFFLLAVLAAYHCPVVARAGAAWQWALLALASLVFYSWENPELLLLLSGSIVFNSIVGQRIALRIVQGRPVSRRLMGFAIGANLLLLAMFKYAGLLGELLLPGSELAGVRETLLDIPLPIGISFYTFHAISFLVDLSRAGSSEPKLLPFAQSLGRGWNIGALGRIALYINFFPQLVAGPIMKARDFMPQIRRVSWGDIPWRSAGRMLIAGFFLKMVVADNLREQTDMITTTNILDLRKLDLLALLYGYSFRIFSDFAGYSLIALGLAALFGYRLPVNFNYPYLSCSITEFWRRWHISLSTWLRDYLYFPLGGNRKGTGRTYLNLFLVMLLGGLWHGASWRYALWGAAHGIFLAIERLLNVKTVESSSRNFSIRQLAGILLTFNLVSWIWLLFAMPDMESLLRFFRALWQVPFGMKGRWAFGVIIYSLPVVAYHLWGYLRPSLVSGSSTPRWRSILEAIAFGIMLYLVLTNSGISGSFIYFQF